MKGRKRRARRVLSSAKGFYPFSLFLSHVFPSPGFCSFYSRNSRQQQTVANLKSPELCFPIIIVSGLVVVENFPMHISNCAPNHPGDHILTPRRRKKERPRNSSEKKSFELNLCKPNQTEQPVNKRHTKLCQKLWQQDHHQKRRTSTFYTSRWVLYITVQCRADYHENQWVTGLHGKAWDVMCGLFALCSVLSLISRPDREIGWNFSFYIGHFSSSLMRFN